MLIEVVLHGQIGYVALNRPEKRKAFDRAMTHGLDEAPNRLDDDPDVRVILLLSNSELSLPAPTSQQDRGSRLGAAAHTASHPLIAVVQGAGRVRHLISLQHRGGNAKHVFRAAPKSAAR